MSQAYPAPTTGPAAPDFIVVVSSDDDYHSSFHQFAEKVNRKLRAGYQLHGQPFNIERTLCQAMLRVGDVPPSGDTTILAKRADEPHLI